MSKTKILSGVGGTVVVLAAIAVGFAFRPKDKPVSLNEQELQRVAASASQTTDGTSGSATTLNQAQTSNQLSTSSSPGSSLGQLNTQQQSSGGTTGASAGADASSNVANMLDPKTFSQYDKYKNDQSGYFAELQKGDGTELTAGKKAAVYYRGWLTNGTLFDESKAGSDGKLQPFVFTLGDHQVITGWEQTLVGMKVGGVRLLIIPPAVGYGAQGQGSIPANAVLVFQVQLAAVQ